jgi:hypothetical protein
MRANTGSRNSPEGGLGDGGCGGAGFSAAGVVGEGGVDVYFEVAVLSD